ncbi:hypothetical protein ABT144_14475 [Streptomyces sp. NPDC002039]|uniref:hypothetical protein n=1 Tax=Streptomyces sp. NPDC002039 TaxID=3154660 RepID=UPI00331F3B2C
MKSDMERDHWSWTPLVAVGMLEFGMRRSEVAAALGRSTAGDDRLGAVRHEHFSRQGVSAYYTTAGHLAAVALSAVTGPQITLGGIPLVGQPVGEPTGGLWPPTLEHFHDYAEQHDVKAAWLPSGDPALQQYGLVLRRVMVGDVVLSRPLLMYSGWTWGQWEEFIPDEEWIAGP